MSTTGRPERTAPASSDIAASLLDSEFVRLVVAATGDGVAAGGLLTKALDAHDIAHQASVVALPAPAQRATDADLTIALGRPSSDADIALGVDTTPASTTALAVATELGTVDYELALAGIIAGGAYPPDDVLGAAAERGIDRRPGVAVPTTELADGLAHSSLVHAPFSGDPETASEMVTAAGCDAATETSSEDERRRAASMVALTVCEDTQCPPQAADAVERFLHPLDAPGGLLATVGGYADVLDAVAQSNPGSAIALTLGALDTETALDTWRAHTSRAHEAVRSASTGRYDGLFVVRSDGAAPLGTVARLVAAYRSPEPLVLAIDDDDAVVMGASEIAASEHVGSLVASAATKVGGLGDGTALTGYATFDCEPTEFVAVLREER